MKDSCAFLFPPCSKLLEVLLTMVEALKNYIDGEFVSCSNHIDSYNPATGEVHLKIPDSGKDEVDKAVKAAKEAFVR